MAVENMRNAGSVFICTVWLQSQMADLIICRKHPKLVPDFLAHPERIPDDFHALRVQYWSKDFGTVKTEFFELFHEVLTQRDIEDIEQIYQLRNAIAHAHISLGRKYMLYRPSSEKREAAVLSAFKPAEKPDAANPVVLKLDFTEPLFTVISAQVGRIDQDCFSRMAAVVGVKHSRIR